jgi:membrane-associated phospholipid phosphatase
VISRRRFVQQVASVVGVLTTSRAQAKAPHQGDLVGEHDGGAENPTSPNLPLDSTKLRSLKTRQQCALFQSRRAIPEHFNNGDEKLLPRRSGNFTKGFPHTQTGEVEPGRYETLLSALETGGSDAFQRLARGSGMRLVSPQAAFSVHLEGADAQTFRLAPPPSVASPEAAAEMVELYWQVLARDIPFTEYGESSVIEKASQDLTRLTRFTGPKRGNRVTPDTIFRANNPGNLAGPYLSQFLWKPVPVGSTKQEQLYRSPAAGNDFVDAYPEWLQLQNGVPPWRDYRWEPERRHIITGRDLTEYIHYDFLYQAFLNAALIIIDSGTGSIYNTNYYFSETNPYKHSKTVMGFVTLGFAQVVDWIGRVTTPALKAAWFQKWLVHRYLRPEEFGGLVHRNKILGADYPLDRDVMESQGLAEIHSRFGTFLLPQAYPEGCPLHPAYPSGHATVAGACATMLKALFDEDMVVPNCVVPSKNGQSLAPYEGPALTVKAEVEKLAFNVAFGRNFAGIHWRSDAVGGIRLGEEVAITILEDLVNTFAEDFPGFQFPRFDGTPVHIAKMA